MPEPVKSKNQEFPPIKLLYIFIVVVFAIVIALIFLRNTQVSREVWSYLIPIVPILVCTIGLGLKQRYYGYSFAISYGATCIAWIVGGSIIGGPEGDTAIFVGGTGLAMTISLFLLIWVIFWKLWRMVSSVKDTSGEVRPSEHI